LGPFLVWRNPPGLVTVCRATDGEQYGNERLDLVRHPITPANEQTLPVDEVAELFVSAADEPGVTESQRKPLVCIRHAFSFTVAAASTFKQRFAEFWKTLTPGG
jgi:hypothetical protein